MFSDLANDLEHFYDLPENKQNYVLAEINRRASRDREGFKKFLSRIGYGEYSHRSLFYEAIWTKPKGWDDFIFEELKQLVETAEKNDYEAIDELSSMLYLTQLEDMSNDFYTNTLHFLVSKLGSKLAEVRLNSLESIGDLADFGKLKFTEMQIQKMQRCLHDSNFKNRIYAYSSLKEMDLIPRGFEIAFIDKMRAKLTGMSDLIE